MKPMDENLILAVDVGNTRIKFGVFAGTESAESARALPIGIAARAVPVAKQLDWDAMTAHFREWSPQIAKAAIAGVNPAGVESVLSGWPRTIWPVPTAVRRAAELPLAVHLEFPDGVGIDRLLDAVAANVLRPPTDPTIVVDAGTATTVNCVSALGVFQGGAILPGLELGARALHEHTALLPLVDVQSLLCNPVVLLGRNTQEAMQSGLWFGQIGAIRELIARLAESLTRQPFVLITGGNGHWLAPALGAGVRYEPDLALRGLAHVAEIGTHE